MGVETLVDPLDMTEPVFVAYLNEINPQGPKAGQVIKAARSFYGWAFRRELVEQNPAEEIQARKHRQGRAPFLEEPDLRRVLSAGFRKDRIRGWTMLLTASTGGREASIAALEPSDIDLERRWVEFRTAKGSKPYGTALGRQGFRAALWLVRDAERTGRQTLVGVKPKTLWRWAEEAGRAAGVKCTFHLLRHSYITKLAEDPTVSDRTIMQLTNWSDLSQLKRYAHVRDQLLRQAQERF
jgi:site-specific recombinase XerD